LTGATGVTFGGSAATSVNVVNSTTVTAVTPAHAAGAVDVVITTPSGSATDTNGYTYLTTAVGQSAYGGKIACLNGSLNNHSA
jgi:fructose/tagatose bisphosphate aldolase